MSIHFPIFILCANLCTDNFWREVYKNLSKGNAPNGVTLTSDNICYKNNIYNYSDKCPNDIIKIVESIVTIKNNGLTKWTHSNTQKKVKEVLIINYLIQLKKEINLSDKEVKKLLDVIKISIIFGDISNDDIEYLDGKILSIKTLNKNTLTIQSKYIRPKLAAPKSSNMLSSKWSSYAKKIGKDPLSSYCIDDYILI